MTIDEFKPNATNRCVEDVPGKMFARVRLGEAEKSTANADLTCSPLAPVVDGAPLSIADAREPPGPQILGVLLAAIWLSTYLGRVRSRHAGNFSRRQRGLDPLSPS